MSDLMKRAAVRQINRNPKSGTVDPIDEASQVSRKVIANQMLTNTHKELTLADKRAEVEAKELDLKVKELERQGKGDSGGGEGALTALLMEDLKSLRGDLATMQERLFTQERERLDRQLQAMQEELNRVRNGKDSQSSIQSLMGQVQEAQELVAFMTPEAPPPPTAGGDTALAAWKEEQRLREKRLELEHERAQWDREDRHTLAMEESRQRNESLLQEVRLKEEHYGRVDRFLTEGFPKALSVAQQLIQALAQRNGPPGAGPLPETRAATVPEGVSALTCAVCNNTVYFRPEWPGVICSQCGTEYLDDGGVAEEEAVLEAPEAPPAPPPEAEATEDMEEIEEVGAIA